MLKNYLKVALLNLRKRSTHAFINITGLALGIASCLLAFIYVRNEVTYDAVHENGKNLYRLNMRYLDNDNTWTEYGSTSPVMAMEYLKQLPELKGSVRISRYSALTRRDGHLQNMGFTFAEPSLFEFFTFPLVSGETRTFATDPNTILLTEETAVSLFGENDPVGQTIEMEFKGTFETLTVRGVLKSIPFNSSIQLSMVLPFSKYEQVVNPRRLTTWLDQHISTFVYMDQPFEQSALEDKLTTILRANVNREDGDRFQVTMQTLADIHLNGSVRGGNGVQPSTTLATSWTLIGIGGFLLLIASINFVNLSIGMALPRTKEIGLRKVAGARRPQIVVQFLGEAFVTCILALLLAVVFVDLFLPLFGRITNRTLSMWQSGELSLILALFSSLVLTAFLAGTYPALVISSFSPVKALKGEEKVGGRNYLTKGLILVQFTLGIAFLLGTMTIRNQLTYLGEFNLGYDDKGLVGIDLFGERGDGLIARFRSEVSASPLIQNVSGNSGNGSRTILNYLGKEYEVNHDRVDYNFFQTFGVPLLKGRSFDPDRSSDKTGAIIVNEAFVRLLDLKDPVGTRVPFAYTSGMNNPEIIGIMPDFHYASLKERVDAMVFYVDPEIDLGQLLVKIDPMQTAAGIEVLHTAWNKLVPDRPFQYGFVDESNARQYAAERKQKEIVSYATLVALFISCLGLFGLTNLTVTQRAKEIGIRKILGATVRQVTWMVSSEFLTIVLLSNLMAWPLAYYFMESWLGKFAYRVSIGWSSFLVAAAVALLIAAVTVSAQSIKSALANPVDSLRNE